MAPASQDHSESDQSSESTESTGGSLPRRPFMKAAGTGLLASSLSGCISDSGTNNTKSNGGKKYSGVSFKFWDGRFYNMSAASNTLVNNLVLRFENKTGASISLNKDDSDQAVVNAWQSNDYPHVMTNIHDNFSPALPTGNILPFKAYHDKFPNEKQKETESVKSLMDFAYTGWPHDQYLIPMTSAPYAPIIGRMDHFEAAGLDPEKDFPPESYEDLIRLGQKLEADGPAKTGFQPIGCGGDIIDVYFSQWASAYGGVKGYTFGRDWSEVNYDSDAWKRAFRENVNAFRKHGQGLPNTPTICEEAMPTLLPQGLISLGYSSPASLPIHLARAPSLWEEGKLKWGTTWGGPKNMTGTTWASGAAFGRKPEGTDEAKWDKSMDAAYEFINWIMEGTDVMTHDFPTIGVPPARKKPLANMVKNDTTTAGGWMSVMKEMLSNPNNLGYNTHPLGEALGEIYEVYATKAFQGKMKPDAAMEKAAAEAQKKVNNTKWGK